MMMSLTSRAANRLRALYRGVLVHMRQLSAGLLPTNVFASTGGSPPFAFEQLEPRVLLSGTG